MATEDVSHDLSSLLSSEERDFLIRNNGDQVPVSGLVGKNILLYFSAQWCPPCRAFLPKLIEAYHTIKAKGSAFEPLPFGDGMKQILDKKFKIEGIPTAVAIGPSGRTITKEARMHLTAYGADAFPFTEEHLKQLEEEIEKKAKGWPEKVKHELHSEHELIRTKRSSYNCDCCGESGYSWSFYCKECDFDLHPKCALKEDEDTGTEKGKEGFICDGDVCRKA
uniref:protein-disulfide reductase n=1 Tax=Salix viminalis TaxID=40686 RepID=A0A6N2N7U6_SALVM